MTSFGNLPIGSVIPVFFDSFAGATGASITITGLAVTDIEIYKGVSMTQRASDAGYVLLDTDGIDLDGITGIQGFSIDTGDNTDAGFYAAGSFYNVVVSAITVDSQTVNFVAATFRLVAAEGTAGTPAADTTRINNVATTAVTTVKAVQGIAVDGVITTVTNQLTAAAIATGVWQDTTAGDFTTALSIGKSVMNGVTLGTGLTVNAVTGLTASNLDAAISSRMATYTQPAGFLAATFPSGTVANTTNITAGTITTTTNLTNLPAITAGWLTAAGIAAGALDGKGNWNIGKTGYALSATGSAALTEDYAADGATFTLNQAVYMIWSLLAERSRSSTTLTSKKLDGATAAMTFTLDSATAPSSQTRAT